jgi:hypothetical protein
VGQKSNRCRTDDTDEEEREARQGSEPGVKMVFFVLFALGTGRPTRLPSGALCHWRYGNGDRGPEPTALPDGLRTPEQRERLEHFGRNKRLAHFDEGVA